MSAETTSSPLPSASRMRALIIDRVFRADLMLQSFALNAVLMAAAVAGFLTLLKSARREGTLLQGGD